jgi:putative membrane protein
MNTATTTLLGALALALIPSVALADEPAAAEGPPPAEVLGKLHHANQMEIEAGKLAQHKGVSKGVKDYGKMLVKDHTAADKKVMTLARQLQVEPESPPGMADDKLMEAAKNATGPAFDQAFAAAMVEDHSKDIAEVTSARDATSNPRLKQLLTELVPTLEKHRQVAQKLVDASAAPAKASVQ